MVVRGIIGAIVGAIILLIFQFFLFKKAFKKGSRERQVKFMDIIVTAEDQKYSLSRFQMYLWTVLIIEAFLAVAAARFAFPEISPNLYMLMGINFAATVSSSAIHTIRTYKSSIIWPDKEVVPHFVADIFFIGPDRANIDLPRTQMFVWTIIIALGFIILVIKGFVEGNPALPDVPTGVLPLMGISHLAYLGTYAAQKKELEN